MSGFTMSSARTAKPTGRKRWTSSDSSPANRDPPFSPDGGTLATAGDDVRLWDVRTGKLKRSITCDRQPWDVKYRGCGKCLAIAYNDGSVTLHDAEGE